MPVKDDLFDFSIPRSVERLRTCTQGEQDRDVADLKFGAALGEVLWWQVAYDEVLRLREGDPTGDTLLVSQATRFARNALAHGDRPWDFASKGLRFPLEFPLSFGWKWREMPEEPKRLAQWHAYNDTFVGEDVEPTLRRHRVLVLGMAE